MLFVLLSAYAVVVVVTVAAAAVVVAVVSNVRHSVRQCICVVISLLLFYVNA